MIAVEAIGCRLVVRVQDVDDFDPVVQNAKKFGIVIADTDDQKRKQAGIDRGEVLAIGPNCDSAYVGGIQVGDFIAFAKYSGKIVTALDDPEDKYLIINDEDVVVKYRSKNG